MTTTMGADIRIGAVVTCDSEALTFALKWATLGVSARPAVPILGCVRLVMAGDMLTVAGFDYEVGASASLPATGVGVVCVSARELAGLVKSMPKRSSVTFRQDGARVLVTCGAMSAALTAHGVDKFPNLPAVGDPVRVFTAEQMQRIATGVAPAASHDGMLPLLESLRFDETGVMAMDRYRLAVLDAPGPWTGPAALVRAAVFVKMARQIRAAGTVTMSLDRTAGRTVAAFTTADGRTITHLCVEGEYPPVRRLFPDMFETELTCGARPLLDGLAQLTPVLARNTPVRLAWEDRTLTLSARGDAGDSSVTIPATFDGAAGVMAFNPSYLADGIRATGGGSVVMRVQENRNKPTLLVNPDDVSLRYLLVPIRFAG